MAIGVTLLEADEELGLDQLTVLQSQACFRHF